MEKFKIFFWYPDIDSCLINNFSRVYGKPEEIITDTKLEKPNIIFLSEQTGVSKENFKIITKKTIAKSKLQQFFEKTTYKTEFHINDEKYLDSQKWSLGGTLINCWEEESEIPREEPLEFKELNEYLKHICPQLSNQLYNEIKKNVLCY